jgi:RimJ/RimL family protein N-acetyltransferase
MENENHIVFLDLPKTRVYLRPQEKKDLDFFRKSLNNERVANLLTEHQPMMEADEEEWFQNLSKNKTTTKSCAIVLKENHELIGSIGLHNINWVSRTAFCGIFIGENFWGQKLGREADMLWLKYAFLTLNLRQVYASVYSFNKRSSANLSKSGYQEVARFPEYIFRSGQYHDVVHFLNTRETWEPLWQEFEKNNM